MKRTRIEKCLLTIFLLLLISGSGIYAQSDTGWTKKKAAAWYKKGQWLNGMTMHPHTSTDQVEFARQYHAHKDWWDKAFAFIRNNDLKSLKPGKYVIDGDNVYADITDNPSSELADAKWHSHGKYCDIQYVIEGKENTGVAPIAGAPIITPFNGKGDSQFYSQDMKGKYYLSEPGSFFIFFPSDVHRPFIKVAGSGPVKRIRFKVRSS